MTPPNPAADALARAVERSRVATETLQQAQEEHREARSEVLTAIQGVATSATPAEKATLARDLYWERPWVDEHDIKSGLGYKTRDEMVEATNHRLTHECPRCHKTLTQTYRDVRVLGGALEYPDKVCGECRDQLRDEYVKRMYES